MKIRHAATLALVGWYLIVPPSEGSRSWACGSGFIAQIYQAVQGKADDKTCGVQYDTPMFDAPLSEWRELKPFEMLADCEAAKLRLALGVLNAATKCIASDDPRFAK